MLTDVLFALAAAVVLIALYVNPSAFGEYDDQRLVQVAVRDNAAFEATVVGAAGRTPYEVIQSASVLR